MSEVPGPELQRREEALARRRLIRIVRLGVFVPLMAVFFAVGAFYPAQPGPTPEAPYEVKTRAGYSSYYPRWAQLVLTRGLEALVVLALLSFVAERVVARRT